MGLFNNLKRDPVKSLNIRTPVCVRSDQLLSDVVRSLRKQHLGCAFVIDSNRKPIGMLTENMLTQIVAKNPDAMHDAVGDYAATHFPKVLETDAIATVLEALEVNNVRFLAVVNKADQIVGLTGQKGLMEFVAEHFPQVPVQKIESPSNLPAREGA